MTDFDNLGKIAIWKNTSDNPKAPVAKGTVIAHRDIKVGESLEIALWRNDSENPKAPSMTGKLSDKVRPQASASQPTANPQDEGFDDDIPF